MQAMLQYSEHHSHNYNVYMLKIPSDKTLKIVKGITRLF